MVRRTIIVKTGDQVRDTEGIVWKVAAVFRGTDVLLEHFLPKKCGDKTDGRVTRIKQERELTLV